MFGIGTTELMIVAVIVVLVFGTGKLRGLGKDLGGAISEFKTSVKDAKEEIEAEDKAAAQKSKSESEDKSE